MPGFLFQDQHNITRGHMQLQLTENLPRRIPANTQTERQYTGNQLEFPHMPPCPFWNTSKKCLLTMAGVWQVSCRVLAEFWWLWWVWCSRLWMSGGSPAVGPTAWFLRTWMTSSSLSRRSSTWDCKHQETKVVRTEQSGVWQLAWPSGKDWYNR